MRLIDADELTKIIKINGVLGYGYSNDERLDDIIETIDEQDTITPKNPWIKCSEGHMPEDDEQYKGRKIIKVLVTTKIKNSNKTNLTKMQRQLTGYTKKVWTWGRLKYGCEEVIAWMPLPDKYVEEK